MGDGSSFFGTMQSTGQATRPAPAKAGGAAPPPASVPALAPVAMLKPPPSVGAAASSGAAAATPTAAATTAATPTAAGAGSRDFLDALRRRLATYCHRREVGQGSLAVFTLMLAVAGGMVFLSGHLGLGAIFGLAALFVGTLATVPVSWAPRSSPLVEGIAPLGDLCLLAGFVCAVSTYYSGVVAALALVVVVILAWLPLVKARCALIPVTAGLWHRGDRLTVLFVGALLGRPVPALLMLAGVAGYDGWLRLERLDVPGVVRGAPPVREPSRFFRDDGTFVPLVRWLSLAVAIAILVVFPIEGAWHF